MSFRVELAEKFSFNPAPPLFEMSFLRPSSCDLGSGEVDKVNQIPNVEDIE